jgi:signal transduction histidine kinase
VRHRLYRRIFLSLLGFVLAALVLAGLAGHLLLAEVVRTHLRSHLLSVGTDVARHLPPAGQPDAELQAGLERGVARWPVAAALFSRAGRRLAFTLSDLPPPPPGTDSPRWLASRAGPVLAVPLSDGRVLVLQPRRLPRPAGFVFAVLGMAALLAAASYPVARLMTRRLESLEEGVRRFGEGDLSARVDGSGDDELASLAASFNRAADRLQNLVEAQRRVLASASHELRSPLARLRLALELAGEDDPASVGDRLKAAAAEVQELDTLVEELLLAGRLELQPPAIPDEEMDLGALVAEEAARTAAAVEIRPTKLRADARLLRVLVRNLLENARRHGLDTPVEAGVEPLTPGPSGARLWVADGGPGVPEEERERIFEPFYRPAGSAGNRREGAGLGLHLVRRIAERYGGTAVCLPREKGGTRFEVTLRPPQSTTRQGTPNS